MYLSLFLFPLRLDGVLRVNRKIKRMLNPIYNETSSAGKTFYCVQFCVGFLIILSVYFNLSFIVSLPTLSIQCVTSKQKSLGVNFTMKLSL